MLQLSTKTVVILASICFIGAIVIQVWWIRSAYEGEVSLYNKEKKQFQSELEYRIKQNQQLKAEIKLLLNYDREKGRISQHEEKLLLDSIGLIIEQILKEKQYGIYVVNYGLGSHKHDISKAHKTAPVTFANSKEFNAENMRKAGRLCIFCLVQNQNEKHDDFNYELVLLYGNEQASIYKKMTVLILGSFSFLLFLGLLFRILLKKYGQEKRLSEAKNEFINNLSHEIQTPVFAIQLANKLIKEKATEQSALRPLVEVIEKETHQLKQHASKILELASLENDQIALNAETVELNAFVEERRGTLEIMVGSRQGKLATRYNNTKLMTTIDRTHFNNVLISLTENAIKYSQGVPEIIIETGEKDEMVFMLVKDNGIGIQPQYLPYVFDKFYRVPGAVKNGTKGFGLGLSYVKQIVKLHGGAVDIKSEPGIGTVLMILLPKTKRYV